MSHIIRIHATDGTPIEFVDELKAQGGMKDVLFHPEKKYVVAFFRDNNDPEAKSRLEMITGKYRERIFNQAGGEYLKKLYCWPTAVVEYQGKLGVVAPFYSDNFFFNYGSCKNDMLQIKGKEKDGKWFASASNRNKYLDKRELGNWMTHIKICLMLARAVRRMHMAGLSHSDLGYKNCLIDPETGSACLIDIDGLVVPGKHPPTVVGTPDFIAPEVMKTSHLSIDDPERVLPSRYTDLHALAVLTYMYLLYRHPLRGDRVLDTDAQKDEALNMGEQALFVEHPTDDANRINLNSVSEFELPWLDTQKIPYSITGPYLSKLFTKAFVDGLHEPRKRPSADEWENALIKTVDLLQPCLNKDCEQGWFVFDNSKSPACPFCHTPYNKKLPILNLYSKHQDEKFRADNHRLMVYDGQSLYQWHATTSVVPNEKLTADQVKRVGYFIFHNNEWLLVNENLPDLTNVDTKENIPIGGKVALTQDLKLLLSNEIGGRLVLVQLSGVTTE